MSQEQNNKDFDNKLEIDGRISYVKIMRLIKILVPMCILMTFTICTVMLVLVANLGRKIDRLEDTLHSLQDGSQTALDSSLITVSDIDGKLRKQHPLSQREPLLLQRVQHRTQRFLSRLSRFLKRKAGILR